MNKGNIGLRIDENQFGIVKIPTINGNIELQIDTGFEKAHYHTQFSEVVFVSDEETEIKPGMWVFHNHNVYATERRFNKDVYWTPREFVYGTEDTMFGDFVMVEKLYEEKDVVLGTVINARVEAIQSEVKDKCRVLTGKYAGMVMYCTDLIFYNIVGYDKKIFIAKERQLISDLEFNPTKDKVIVKWEDDDFLIKKDSGIIVKRHYTRPQSKTGLVMKADNSMYIGKKIVYSKFYQITIGKDVYHIVDQENIQCALEEETTEELLIPLEI
jgi:hypothetical protein